MTRPAKQIIGEACVHHLWFDDASYRDRGNLIKWNPPIRKALRPGGAGKSCQGGSDRHHCHRPRTSHTLEEKRAPYFSARPQADPIVQHSLVDDARAVPQGRTHP
ncbi:MAG: hypothetical protein MZV63_52295 [Marinilabiliales bacterium]|nr:hypothetical protein [Marinilabiliales bacterium]